uniref:Uncharacterized protein n=1 Tax=Panagrolaimus sp. ES5 TaxID=591445 RepID=A0AC34G854_9BILA
MERRWYRDYDKEPSWIVSEGKCDIYFRENNCNDFMIKFIKRLFSKPELLLSYKWQNKEKLEEAKRVYQHYYKTEDGEDHGMAKDAVKRALTKCRNYRRQKIYNLGQKYTCITSDNDIFFYNAQDVYPYRLIPYSDPELEIRMDTSHSYFVDDLVKVPRKYKNCEYLILIKKT